MRFQEISKITFGSHLYGTSHPESDLDFRGVYLPSRRDCYLGTIKDVINDPSEEDTQYFSLQKFMRLAAEGQSVALEMLFAPPEKVLGCSTWTKLHENRHRFLTKKMKSFMGFAKSMSSKYSSRVDRLNEIETLTKCIENVFSCSASTSNVNLEMKLSVIWEILPESTNLVKSENQFNKSYDNRIYIVCGREYQATSSINYLYKAAKDIRDSYGERVRKAQSNDVDYKALMHAFRVCYQCQQAANENEITFPCKEVQFLRDVRFGKYNVLEDKLDEILDNLIIQTEELVKKSNLLEEVDWEWCENFIVETYR